MFVCDIEELLSRLMKLLIESRASSENFIRDKF